MPNALKSNERDTYHINISCDCVLSDADVAEAAPSCRRSKTADQGSGVEPGGMN
jgi:hypothetical protein